MSEVADETDYPAHKEVRKKWFEKPLPPGMKENDYQGTHYGGYMQCFGGAIEEERLAMLSQLGEVTMTVPEKWEPVNYDGRKVVDVIGDVQRLSEASNKVIEDIQKGSAVRNGLEGVGPDAPTVVNEKGGRQSLVKGRYDLLPPRSIIEVSKILDEGAQKYGIDNWRLIGWRSHLNHTMQHLFALLANDDQDDHIGHMTCRAMMAHEQYLEGVE